MTFKKETKIIREMKLLSFEGMENLIELKGHITLTDGAFLRHIKSI